MNQTTTLTDDHAANESLQLSKSQKACVYLLFGVLIGDILITAAFVFDLNYHDFFLIKTYTSLITILCYGYFLGLIVAFIPAILTATFIEKTKTTKHQYLHAFASGCMVCFFCFIIPTNILALPLSIVGGVAAASSLHLINRIERKMNKAQPNKKASKWSLFICVLIGNLLLFKRGS